MIIGASTVQHAFVTFNWIVLRFSQQLGAPTVCGVRKRSKIHHYKVNCQKIL